MNLIPAWNPLIFHHWYVDAVYFLIVYDQVLSKRLRDLFESRMLRGIFFLGSTPCKNARPPRQKCLPALEWCCGVGVVVGVVRYQGDGERLNNLFLPIYYLFLFCLLCSSILRVLCVHARPSGLDVLFWVPTPFGHNFLSCAQPYGVGLCCTFCFLDA